MASATVTDLRKQADKVHEEKGTGGAKPPTAAEKKLEAEKKAVAAVNAGLDGNGAGAGSVFQGTIDGAWEKVVGGKAPTHKKVKLQGGALEIEPPKGGWKKGSLYSFELVAKVSGADVRDTEDAPTGQVVDTSLTFILKPKSVVLGGVVPDEAA